MVREKINQEIKNLKNKMNSNDHLKNPEDVIRLSSNISRFSQILTMEDKKYLEDVNKAIATQKPWSK